MTPKFSLKNMLENLEKAVVNENWIIQQSTGSKKEAL